MAFFQESNQIRLRFSRFAEEVIENDMMIFEEPRRNTFVNTVLENYIPYADASISLRIDEYHDHLISILGEKASRQFAAPLLGAREKELTDKVSSYGKPGKGCENSAIRLRNDLFDDLTDELNGSAENRYYCSLSEYIRAVLEEYARLPFRERDRIFHLDTYLIIEEALALKCQLLLTTSGNSVYHVLPHSVQSDPAGAAFYLIGYSYKENEDRTQKRPSSFRISTLRDIRTEKSRNSFISSADKERLENEISAKGIQFLVSDSTLVRVRLTPEGIRSFRHQLNLRPVPFSIEGDIYSFKCSLAQARFYFFKFGNKAEILEPSELRDLFAKDYKDACDVYNGQ